MSEASSEDLSRVDAEPTKEFFINMLVRDIELIPAVVDLIDNSVDGARRLRGDGPYDGLRVLLEVQADRFSIYDNCGGIPLDVARRYAFRFGRTSARPATENSIGQFGVGMKRTLFKLGNQFSIDSSTANDRFLLNVDVDRWRQEPSWDFVLDDYAIDLEVPTDDTHTKIEVTELHQPVTEDLSTAGWVNQLAEEVRSKHRQSLSRGLYIAINGNPLNVDPLELLSSEDLRPGRRSLQFGSGANLVRCELWAGVGSQDSDQAGWYVFCNGRLVLGPDRSSVTVWGANHGAKVPRYHGQYARFRGYAVFTAENPSLLPWTTTKIGIDGDSAIWRAARQEMGRLSRPVTLFLNALDRQRDFFDEREEDGTSAVEAAAELLQSVVARAESLPYQDAPTAQDFTYPEITGIPTLPKTASIQYREQIARIDKLKTHFNLGSNREVGEATFEYAIEAEGL